MPDYVDIHSHLNFPQFDADRDEAIARMREASVWTITVGTDAASSRQAVELAAANDGFFACVGAHPTHDDPEMTRDALLSLGATPKVVAVGETGLDYYRIEAGDEAEKARQRRVFAMHIEAALELGLPLMIHAREAYGEVHDILASYAREHGEKVRANMHFFAGSVDDARGFLELGFTLSFDGPITFASSYDETIRYAPLDRIMAETDAPFAAPAPWRGRRNEPAYVRAVAERIADIRGEDREAVRKALVETSFRAFGLTERVARL